MLWFIEQNRLSIVWFLFNHAMR